MINVVNKTIQNTIYCPKNLTETEVNFVFDIHSEITNKSFVFDVIDQSSGSSYYKFDVLFDEVPDGEYNWYVLLSGETRSEGLIRIGNWNPASNGTAYHLIQYDAAGYSPIDLQTKQVEINSEGLTTVEPDNGFVGLKEVQVYVDVPNEYEEGFEDGEAAQKAKLIALEVTANGRYEREDGYNQVDVDVDTTPYYESGYTAGYEAGYESGSTEGSEEGYESGYTAGVEAGEAQQKAKLITTAITENGTYSREDGFSSVSVDVPTVVNNQNKTVEYTENGTYIVVPAAGYSGLGSVTINTNVPHTGHTDAEMEQAYQSGYTSGETVGYTSGKTDGVAEQKAKLVETAITINGVYEKEDGYKKVTVNVPQTGSTINNQDKTVPIITNGTTAVTFDAGYTGLGTVTINTNVPTGHTDAELEAAYASGVTDGEVTQKAKLITTAVTTNGTYSRADGYSSITVNVPTGGTINNQDKTVTYPTNGTYTVTADAGYTGLGTVTVNVDTSGSTPESRVSVTLMNQILIGQAGFTFTYDGGSTAYTFTEATVTIGGLLPGKTYQITYNSVYGYITPDLETGVTMYDSLVQALVLYEQEEAAGPLTMTVNTGNLSMSWPCLGYGQTKSVRYSIDGGAEQTLTGSGATINLSAGNVIQFWGDNNDYDVVTGYSVPGGIKFTGTGSVSLSGNIMSLVDSTGYTTATTLSTPRCFSALFAGNSVITDASKLKLPATTLTTGCYGGMFRNCIALRSAPSYLPATTISSNAYHSMFKGCTSLTVVPTILAVSGGVQVMTEMFMNCTSLTVGPDINLEEIPQYGCSSMFKGCTSLTAAPALKGNGTVGYGGCQEMFSGCTALRTASEINYTILTGNSFYNMFYGCGRLNYIKCMVEDHSANNSTWHWVEGVASTGTFVKSPNATWGSGVNSIPEGWTVQDAS